jgi:hypothetical protein
VGIAGIFVVYIHEDVIAAIVVIGVVDQVDLNIVAVLNNHHGVIGILVDELKAQDLVEGQRPLQLGHTDPDMVHPFDVDCHRCLLASASRQVDRHKLAPFALSVLLTIPKQIYVTSAHALFPVATMVYTASVLLVYSVSAGQELVKIANK